MSELRVRDHSQPCEHPSGYDESLHTDKLWTGAFRATGPNGSTWWSCYSCPGGREIRLERFPLMESEDFVTLSELASWEVWVEVR